VDDRFQPVLSPMDGRQPMRYALRAGSQDVFSVDVLCPLRGRVIPEQLTNDLCP
jgi:hypothetical protein